MCTIPYFVHNLGSFSTVEMSVRICWGSVFKRDLRDAVNITYSWWSWRYFQSDSFLVVGGADLCCWGSGDSCDKTQQSQMTCKVINFLMRSVLKRGTSGDTNTVLTFGHTAGIQSSSSSNMPQFSSPPLLKNKIIQALPRSMASIEIAYLHNELLSPSDKFWKLGRAPFHSFL